VLEGMIAWKKHGYWVYVLPIFHVFICLISYIGLAIPLQHLGILFSLVLLADLPVSIVAYGLAWKYSVLAYLWTLVAGTLWWYLLSRCAEALFIRFVRRE